MTPHPLSPRRARRLPQYRDEANFANPLAKKVCRAACFINAVVLSDGFNNFVIMCIMLA